MGVKVRKGKEKRGKAEQRRERRNKMNEVSQE